MLEVCSPKLPRLSSVVSPLGLPIHQLDIDTQHDQGIALIRPRMNAGKKSARRAVQSRNGVLILLDGYVPKANNHAALSRDNTCSSCLHRLNISTTSRRHASAAAAAAEQPASSENEVVASSTPPATATGPRKVFRLLCSPVVSRPPILTRELTSFEKAFFLYQKRLNERLALPFTRYFYYKKDTPADTQWKRQAKARKGTASRDVGVYNAYDEEGWNDEVLVGSQLSEPSDVVEKLIRDAEGKDIVDAEPQGDAEAGGEASGNPMAGEGTRKPVSEITVERPQPRTTKDDAENNKQSLNRKLERTLYMVVKNKDGAWRFPQDRVLGRESLHQVRCSLCLEAPILD